MSMIRDLGVDFVPSVLRAWHEFRSSPNPVLTVTSSCVSAPGVGGCVLTQMGRCVLSTIEI